MAWYNILITIGLIAGGCYGLFWAWRNDYLSWSAVRDSLGFEGIKETIITIFSQPTFLFLYLCFVLAPVWVLSQYLKLYDIPLWQKLLLSVGGIWAVDRVMVAKDLK